MMNITARGANQRAIMVGTFKRERDRAKAQAFIMDVVEPTIEKAAACGKMEAFIAAEKYSVDVLNVVCSILEESGFAVQRLAYNFIVSWENPDAGGSYVSAETLEELEAGSNGKAAVQLRGKHAAVHKILDQDR